MKPPDDSRTAPEGPATRNGEDEEFLARWSRRKQQAREAGSRQAGEHAAGPLADVGQTTGPAGGDAAPREDIDAPAQRPGFYSDESDAGSEAESLSADAADPDPPLELPSIDSLDENSDYSAFLTPGVAASLQRRALRKLFHSPKFNIRDGLDDYDLDFSNPEPLGDIVTADMRHRLLKELERLADAVDDDAGPADETATAATAGVRDPTPSAAAVGAVSAADGADAADEDAADGADDGITDDDTMDDTAHDDGRPRPI